LILASGSPQRRELLARLGVPFTVRVTDVPELEQGPDPARVALQNALAKARAGRRAERRAEALAQTPVERSSAPGAPWVLGCDTIVVLDGTIYGKPADEAQARATISALGGRTHEVISGVALLLGDGEHAQERTATVRSRVTFRALDEALLDWYVSTGEWRGRSGGYAIQGATGARLALGVEGEEENVVGLPLRAVRELAPELFGQEPAASGS
jgi:septum formation protein